MYPASSTPTEPASLSLLRHNGSGCLLHNCCGPNNCEIYTVLSTVSNPVLRYRSTPRTHFARQLSLFTQVMEAAVIAVPHPKWTERPLLVVVAAPNSSLSRDVMLQFLQVRCMLEPRIKDAETSFASGLRLFYLPCQCYCTDGAECPEMQLLASKRLLVSYTAVMACSSSINMSSQSCADRASF